MKENGLNRPGTQGSSSGILKEWEDKSPPLSCYRVSHIRGSINRGGRHTITGDYRWQVRFLPSQNSVQFLWAPCYPCPRLACLCLCRHALPSASLFSSIAVWLLPFLCSPSAYLPAHQSLVQIWPHKKVYFFICCLTDCALNFLPLSCTPFPLSFFLWSAN